MARVRRMKLDIDLKEIFGTRVEDRALREAIAEKIIEKIKERTQSGLDKDGRPFKSYSKDYKDSLAFEVYGKSSQVDMTLTGDMLETMDVVEQNGNRISIGWNDSTQNAKAFNHITGDTVPRRDFFGLTEKEKDQIRGEFEDTVLSFRELARTRGREEFVDRALAEIDRLRATVTADLEEED